MGRLLKQKIDQIRKLREEGYTQKETAEKVGVHLRTARKYDPIRQKGTRPTREQIEELGEALGELVANGLVQKLRDGRLRITSLGKRTYERFEELRTKAMLQFIVDQGGSVREGELQRYLDEIDDELFYQAINETKGPSG